MRVGTRMIDGKGKDNYSDRLSMQGGIRGKSESWYLPSLSMVVRIDENDEQCQSQERNQDHMDGEKIDGFWYLGSQLPLE